MYFKKFISEDIIYVKQNPIFKKIIQKYISCVSKILFQKYHPENLILKISENCSINFFKIHNL